MRCIYSIKDYNNAEEDKIKVAQLTITYTFPSFLVVHSVTVISYSRQEPKLVNCLTVQIAISILNVKNS